MRPEVIRSVRRTELEASSESRSQFQFARACHALARVMRCLQLDQIERQRYRLRYSRGQHVKAIVIGGGRRTGLRERSTTANRKTVVDATGIEPVTPIMVKRGGRSCGGLDPHHETYLFRTQPQEAVAVPSFFASRSCHS